MPELPDALYFSRYIDATSLHQEIISVDTIDPKVLANTSPRQLDRSLRGRSFTATQRHGKAVALLTEHHPVPILAFGMTGFPSYSKTTDPPENGTGVRFNFKDAHLDFVIKRKLGRIHLADSLNQYIEDHSLGPDALDLSTRTLRQQLQGRTGLIKPTLMNQSVIAGLGNIYTDEALFHARVRPDRKTNSLKAEETRRIAHHTRRILRIAAKHHAKPSRFPKTWLIPQRQDEKPTCPRCAGTLQQSKISGRRAVFCTNCQH